MNKKKQGFFLNAISRLDEDVLDRASKKRFYLWGKWKERQRKKRNFFIRIGSVAACVAILIPLLALWFGLGNQGDFPGVPPVGGGGQVPIYTGMTVSGDYKAPASASAGGMLMLARGNGNDNNGNNGNHFGNDKKPIGDAAADHLGITPAPQDRYFTKPNSDIYITVHFENPDEYEILSFRLNGVKYAVQQFLPGSDLENLIVKINVGDVEGLLEYTITEIKYVDGESITERDVEMRGEDTIKVYVSYKTQPSATISGETVGFDSLAFNVNLTDPNSLIAAVTGEIWAVLYDGDAILQKKQLSLGDNVVEFTGLTTGTLYQYAIVAVYDSYDGNGKAVHVLKEKTFNTESPLTFTDTRLVGNTFYFSLEWHEAATERELISLKLYRNGEKERDVPLDAESVGALTENRDYTLVATYLFAGKRDTIEVAFSTKTVYAITLVSNGGTDFGTVYLSADDDLPVPVREGYTFGGWYSDIEQTDKVTEVPQDDATLYAWWREETRVGKLTYGWHGDYLAVTNVTDSTLEEVWIPAYIGNNRVDIVEVGYFSGNNIKRLTTSSACSNIAMSVIQSLHLIKGDGPIDLNFYDVSPNFYITVAKDVTISNLSFVNEYGQLSPNQFRIDAANPYVKVDGNCLIDLTTKTLILGAGDSVIPTDGSVEVIGAGAFMDCKKLTSIVIPDSVTSIGNGAFGGCEKLSSVTLSKNLTSIGVGAFMDCKKLTSIVIPDSVTSIGGDAFWGCTMLSSVTLSKNLTSIGVGAFTNCVSLERIVLPDGLLSIGADAFMSCTSLTDINIPDSVTSIGNDAFHGCPLTYEEVDGVRYLGPVAMEAYVRDIVIREGTTIISYGILSEARSVTLPTTLHAFPDFSNNRTIERVVFTGGLQEIPQYAFRDCTSLCEVVLPDGLLSIGSYAFRGCTDLREVVIPDSVRNIGWKAFYNCTSLPLENGVSYLGKWAISSDKTLTTATLRADTVGIAGGCFELSSITSVTLPEGLRYISHLAFSACLSLKELNIPASVEYIGGNPVGYCKAIERVTLADGNKFYHMANGFLIETATKTVVWGWDPRDLPTDGSVEAIRGAFEGIGTRVTDLTELVLPAGIVRIEAESFFGAVNNLVSLTLPKGLEYIGTNAFSGAKALTDIYFGGTMAEWEAIEKEDWITQHPDITVHCTDGDVIIPAA